ARVRAEPAWEPFRHRLGDVEREMPAPGMADDVRRLPAERVEDAAGILHISRHRVRPPHRGRLPPPLPPLPPGRVEAAAGILHISRHRVRPSYRGRLLPSLLVPRDVVLVRELV